MPKLQSLESTFECASLAACLQNTEVRFSPIRMLRPGAANTCPHRYSCEVACFQLSLPRKCFPWRVHINFPKGEASIWRAQGKRGKKPINKAEGSYVKWSPEMRAGARSGSNTAVKSIISSQMPVLVNSLQAKKKSLSNVDKRIKRG